MSVRRKLFRLARSGACVGLGVVLTLGVVSVRSGPDQVGGSLPLQGDEFVSGNGAPVDQTAFGTGSHWNVFNWAPGELGAVPTSFSYNYVDASGKTVKKIYLATGAQPDVPAAESVGNLSTSLDSGRTFLNTDRNFTGSSFIVRLRDGTFVAPGFTPEWTDQTQTAVNLKMWKSKNGVTWTEFRAPVTMPAEYQLGPMSFGLRVHRRPMQLADGTLLVPFYTVFRGTSKQRSGFLQSTDNGASWSLRSVIPATNQPGTNEVGWSRTSDGRLIAVLRTTHTPETHAVQSFSDDDGRTWSEPVDVVGPDGVSVNGIFSDLILQPNGTLLLTVGRPDVRVLVSNDGTGRSWDVNSTVFANYPSSGNNGRYDGTSGNNTMENLSASRSVLFYDQCHVWGCGAYDQQFGVSAEYVASVTPGVGKIDLATKLRTGTATITGSFAKPNKTFPEMRPEGAFDGSSDVQADARLVGRNGAAGELVVKLDKAYQVNRIGLMLGHGEKQSATVLTSMDGVAWSEPVVKADNRSDWSMRYTDFAARSARYIKVVGAPGVTTTVTEMEIYSADVDGFENELPFAVPRGWTEATHAWVTDVPNNPAYNDFGGSDSSTALRLWDKWTDDNARISRPFPPTQQVRATMQWGASDTRARFNFGVRGTTADGSVTTAWQFRLAPGNPAALQVFDGSSWTTVGQLSGPLPTRTYLPLTITATPTSATVTLGGDTFTTSIKAADVASLSTLTFTTGDPVEYGGIYFLDDVSVTVAAS